MAKLNNTAIKLLTGLLFISLLTACGKNNDTGTTAPTKSVTQLPLAALTVPDLTGLRAHIILDGNTGSPITMSIDTVNHTASASIPSLSRANHTVQIVYEYFDGVNTFTIAQSSVHNVDLSGGSTSLNIPDTDYNMNAFDDDADGLSNGYELAVGTNPGSSSCVIGYSLVGSCTM